MSATYVIYTPPFNLQFALRQILVTSDEDSFNKNERYWERSYGLHPSIWLSHGPTTNKIYGSFVSVYDVIATEEHALPF
jgi:hypothetical protein